MARILALLALLILAALPAQAARCGEFATGRDVFGDIYTGQWSMRYVDQATGRWAVCKPHLKDGDDPTTPEPVVHKDCPSDGQPRTWVVGENVCTSTRSFYGQALPSLKHGHSTVLTNDIGAFRGNAAYRCTDGVVTEFAAKCDEATACDSNQTIGVWVGAVTINALGNPQPSGTVTKPLDVQGLPKGYAGAATFRCERGEWLQISNTVKRVKG